MIKNVFIVIGIMLFAGLGLNARLLVFAKKRTIIVFNIMWGVLTIFVLIILGTNGAL